MSLSTATLQKCVHETSHREMHAQEREERSHQPPVATSDADLLRPDPNLFTSLESPESNIAGDLPTAPECAVHLELLQCFHELRRQVLQSKSLDRNFEIIPKPRTVRRYGKVVKLRDTTFQEQRKMKWLMFTRLAAARFLFWVESLERLSEKGSTTSQDYGDLPPLDILMAWHSFLLNPKDYMNFCRQYDLLILAESRLPWSRIHKAIDRKNWSYSVQRPAATSHEEPFHRHPDLFVYLTGDTSTIDIQAALGLAKRPDEARWISRETISRLLGGSSDPVSPFLLACLNDDWRQQIREAIERQASFVSKMNNQLWIRSPVLEGTLDRAIGRYEKLLKLSKIYPKQIFVPSLDIDLVWHTLQCSARQYRDSVECRLRQFVNHNDKLGSSTLNSHMETTKRLWKVRFGQAYSRCFCWDCETVLSAVEAKAGSDQTSGQMDHLASEVVHTLSLSRATEMRVRMNQTRA